MLLDTIVVAKVSMLLDTVVVAKVPLLVGTVVVAKVPLLVDTVVVAKVSMLLDTIVVAKVPLPLDTVVVPGKNGDLSAPELVNGGPVDDEFKLGVGDALGITVLLAEEELLKKGSRSAPELVNGERVVDAGTDGALVGTEIDEFEEGDMVPLLGNVNVVSVDEVFSLGVTLDKIEVIFKLELGVALGTGGTTPLSPVENVVAVLN
jgi:hypothetical protein